MREALDNFFSSLSPEAGWWVTAVLLTFIVIREVRLLFFYRGRFNPLPAIVVVLVLGGAVYYFQPSAFKDVVDSVDEAVGIVVDESKTAGEGLLAVGFSQESSPSKPKGTPYIGKVRRVIDGDTFDLLINRDKHRIRFARIDAPEKSQPHGRTSTRALKKLIDNEVVTVYVTKVDRYDRLIGTVFYEETDVGSWMIEQGHAWWYRQYSNSRTLALSERTAREQRLGLWASENPVPPWDWRRGVRRSDYSQESVENVVEAREQLRCGSKKYCGQMNSCEEAKFYLNVCGLKRLDGDSDGVPCEAMCR